MSSPWKCGHQLVADELVDVTEVRFDNLGLHVEVAVEHVDDLFGLDRLGEGGEAPHVREQHGDPLASSLGE